MPTLKEDCYKVYMLFREGNFVIIIFSFVFFLKLYQSFKCSFFLIQQLNFKHCWMPKHTHTHLEIIQLSYNRELDNIWYLQKMKYAVIKNNKGLSLSHHGTIPQYKKPKQKKDSIVMWFHPHWFIHTHSRKNYGSTHTKLLTMITAE